MKKMFYFCKNFEKYFTYIGNYCIVFYVLQTFEEVRKSLNDIYEAVVAVLKKYY